MGGRPRSWMLEGLFAARGRPWGTGGKVREEREREVRSLGTYGGPGGDVTHARGTVNASRYPTNAPRTNPPSPPRSNPVYLERTKFPHCHPCSLGSLLLTPAMSPFPTPFPSPSPRVYPSAGRCVQFADVKCNISPLSTFVKSLHAFLLYRHHPIPPRPPNFPLPSSSSLSHTRWLCTVYASSTSTRVYRAHTLFIDSCQS